MLCVLIRITSSQNILLPMYYQCKKKKIILNLISNIMLSAAMGFFSKAFKNELETAVVNEPSVF